ncbi:hypothetical protein RRG08_058205 [Elysia crispata]|uniref:Uncharacterized protein n=1 Tax=Elysia crispata TaxID=231223 RepID=A0AAE1E7B1_9GAST|nr:hypothetical protein RRG08_058205 [Elysia crispata]
MDKAIARIARDVNNSDSQSSRFHPRPASHVGASQPTRFRRTQQSHRLLGLWESYPVLRYPLAHSNGWNNNCENKRKVLFLMH